ncbi:hypothetical protein ACKAV7_001914 [Fusarium commune]|uniref:Transcription factor atf21 n=1 Tax=Fusarium oxysporum f. sp. rapae TaxID=485398 RepID=A0A8J5PKA7_FUSOX|nr:Transcription factor atf21 [Fusarium oxysporum f. sp. rapae]
MLDGYIPDETIGGGLTVCGAAVLSHPRLEFSESVYSSDFVGASQDEVDLTTLSRQARLSNEQFEFYEDVGSGDRWVDDYSIVKNQSLLPEYMRMVADEPPSTLTPLPQLSQEPLKKPGRKRKTQLSELAGPISARRKAKGDNNKDDQRRKGIITNKNGINVTNNATNRKYAKHKQVQERNRIAANKCRMRKKQDQTRLQSVEQDMEQRHMMLSSCVDNLKEEVLYLKTQLLQHTSCDCTLIHHHIEKEAQRYADTLGLR